jgi:hypothetical protein
MDDSTVMLSEAKHLFAHCDRPFAEFTLSVANVLRACPEAKPNGVTVKGPISSSGLFFETPLSAYFCQSTTMFYQFTFFTDSYTMAV